MSSASLRKKSLNPDTATRLIDSETEDNPVNLKRHRNLKWLYMEMEKLSDDVIDREICKRLRQFSGQLEYDLPNDIIKQIKEKSVVNTDNIPEGLLPFYRHYNFMYQRNEKSRAKSTLK